MDLKSGFPFWLLKNGISKSYPSLKKTHSTEVLIIGGGISGALAAYHLVYAGYDVTIVDRRHFGTGSTSASTALIQYETDEHLTSLTEKYGIAKSVRCHQLTFNAVKDLEKLINKHKIECGFSKRPSLYLASIQKDKKKLIEEYNARISAGFELELWDKKQIESTFDFTAPIAIWNENSAELDALKLTYALLKIVSKKDVNLFDGTSIVDIIRKKNYHQAITNNEHKIKAKHIVIASGYESEQFLNEKFSRLHSTYAIAGEPVSASSLWYRNCLIWESARPYLYMRTTSDNRIIIGGKDEPFYSPNKRDKLLSRKSRDLKNAFKKKFPDIKFVTDFRWTGTFAETKDSLPFIDKRRGLFFILGFGGNGITYSQMAGSLLPDLIENKSNPDQKLFSFGR